MSKRADLEKWREFARSELKGRDPETLVVETPEGIRIKPLSLEFWHDRPFRLHDRVVFRRENPDGAWSKARLYP